DRNLALLVFAPNQLKSAGEFLAAELGREQAIQIIRKNPGVLSIPPASLKENLGGIVAMADYIGFFADNPLLAKLLLGALGLWAGYFVLYIGIFKPLWESPSRPF
ncbi:unnamed protein product, partial [Polarella glacialis]